jgi:hypothetical protein
MVCGEAVVLLGPVIWENGVLNPILYIVLSNILASLLECCMISQFLLLYFRGISRLWLYVPKQARHDTGNRAGRLHTAAASAISSSSTTAGAITTGSCIFYAPIGSLSSPTLEELVQYTVKPQSIVFEGTTGANNKYRKMTVLGTALNVSETSENKRMKISHLALRPTKIINNNTCMEVTPHPHPSLQRNL